MTEFEKFMENAMGKVNFLVNKYDVTRSEAIELLKMRELDYIDSKLSEMQNTLVDEVAPILNGIRNCLDK